MTSSQKRATGTKTLKKAERRTRSGRKSEAGKSAARKTNAQADSNAALAAPGEGGEASSAKGRKAAPRARKLTPRQIEKIRRYLRDKQAQISRHMQAELSELESPDKGSGSDIEDLATDADGTDSLCEIMDIEATQIVQIETALKKIDEGTYGICEDCGGEIASARLEALPFATQCIECKRRAEEEASSSFLASPASNPYR
ncbi:MAG: TraR/DksA family transcriptional regulator [Planctomycetes bacterium]|nr:TraR/DksA family transcriptional regulator [Planctomycetota bacterium]